MNEQTNEWVHSRDTGQGLEEGFLEKRERKVSRGDPGEGSRRGEGPSVGSAGGNWSTMKGPEATVLSRMGNCAAALEKRSESR